MLFSLHVPESGVSDTRLSFLLVHYSFGLLLSDLCSSSVVGFISLVI